MTRLLALASARPAASVNMNGRSAVVNARAEVVFQAPVAGRAVLDASLPTGIGNPTPFVRWGNIPAGIFWGCLLLLLALMRLCGHFCQIGQAVRLRAEAFLCDGIPAESKGIGP